MTIIRIWRKVESVNRSELPVYVCLCNGVTDRAIREVAEAGCNTMSELTMRTGCGASCGSCIETAMRIIDEVHASRPMPLPVLSHAA